MKELGDNMKITKPKKKNTGDSPYEIVSPGMQEREERMAVALERIATTLERILKIVEKGVADE